MILVSLIPFFFSYKFIIDAVDIDTVINRAPRLVLAILPLYIPVLWLSISSSKKMNLSKRLLKFISNLKTLNTIKNMGIILNNVGQNKGFGYSYSYNYGYGYGYDNDPITNTSVQYKIKKWYKNVFKK